jgi:carbamoyl-phosphate synthase large subunit
MKLFRILVTHAGGPAAISVIKSLQCSKFKNDIVIVAVDSDPTAAGLFLADIQDTLPDSTQETQWKDSLFELIDRHNINVILQTGESDVALFSKFQKQICDAGVQLLIPTKLTIDTCQDKYTFYSLCKHEFKLPLTSLTKLNFPGKKIIKPVRGSGSRNIQIVEQQVSLQPGFMIQYYVDGPEYSVDVLCDESSNMLVGVVRERIQTKAGISTKGRIVNDTKILNECAKICMHLNIKGPACIQLKREGNDYFFLEINPRFAGGLFFSTLAGVNIPEMMLEHFSGNSITINQPKEITVVRYFNEIVI